MNLKNKTASLFTESAMNITSKLSKMKLAFTLAEVLITLGIIGVVATITIPTLITNIQDKQFRVKFKESISIISQAMKTVYADTEETYTTIDWTQMPVYFCKLEKPLKVMNSGIDCSKVDEDSIYESSSNWPLKKGGTSWDKKWYDKKGNPQILNGAYQPLTMDLINGMRINFNCFRWIWVDVNGEKGPNTVGRDIYMMYVLDGESSPTLGFKNNNSVTANACTQHEANNSTPSLNSKNYVEDCLHGSGWGCSFMLN